MIATLFILLLILLLLGVPIFFSLGLASAITVWSGDLTQMLVVVQEMFNSINSFPLMAIPFFLLAGSLMQHGGISLRLVNFANSLVGNMSGGLALVAIVTSMFFAAISGSGAATTAAIGAILIPAMVQDKYDIKFAAANQAAAGSLGIIIPPSIPMIIYGIAAGTSIGDMFIAGIIPGIVVTLSLAIYAYFYSKKRGHKGEGNASLKDVFITGRKAILAILMPVIVLGGIYGGIFTPTEAAVVAVVYSFIIGFFVYREISIKKLVMIFQDAAITSAVILGIIAGAGIFARIIQILNVPELFSNVVTSTIGDNQYLFLLVAVLIFLIVGMFIEAAAAILMLVPILLPVAIELGVDPVHFGMIMIISMAIGMYTPPVGLNLFVASKISGVSAARLTVPIIPFVLVMLVAILILTFIPALTTWLPSLLNGN